MAVSGLGTGIGVTISDGSKTYSNVLSVQVSGVTCGITDISSASSASQCSEFLPALIDAGFLICVLRYGASGAGAETEVDALEVLLLARTVSTWTLTIPGGASGGTWVASGFIVKLGQAVQYKNGVQVQFVVKLTGVPAWTVAA